MKVAGRVKADRGVCSGRQSVKVARGVRAGARSKARGPGPSRAAKAEKANTTKTGRLPEGMAVKASNVFTFTKGRRA